MMLEADALLRAGADAGGQQAIARYEQAHGVLERVAALADQHGLPVERGRALYNDGLAYERQDRPEQAIERYRQALAVTSATDDVELLNLIRGTAAIAYENQGSTAGAIGMLDEISRDLSLEDDPEATLELAENLFEKGRLLNATYRFGP